MKLVKLLIALTATTFFVFSAHAATFNVNTTADTVDAAPGDTICADSSGNCSLRAALMEANNIVGVTHTIVLPAGTYSLTVAQAEPDYGDAKFGDLDINGSIIIQGAGANTTTVTANGNYPTFVTYGTSANANISNVTITGSSEFGFYAGYDGIFTFTGCHITNNALGGINLSNNSTITVTNSTIDHNGNGSQDGGGISTASNSVLFVTNSSITDNSGSDGAGIYLGSDTDLTLTNSLVANNYSHGDPTDPNNDPKGGGIYAASNNILILTNSTIANNATDGTGGGLYLVNADFDFGNVTVAGNQADADADTFGTAGGIYVNAPAPTYTTSIRNSIISNNTDGNITPDCSGTIKSMRYSLIGNSTGCTVTTSSNNLFNTDPLLQSLADNGGNSHTMALGNGSPAIDAATPTGCKNALNILLTTDQRGSGFPRALDGNLDGNSYCDMGAAEYLLIETSCTDGTDNDGNGDIDCDDSYCATACADADADSILAMNDCDDTNNQVYPGATEICGDSIDQDCDGIDLVCPVVASTPSPTTTGATTTDTTSSSDTTDDSAATSGTSGTGTTGTSSSGTPTPSAANGGGCTLNPGTIDHFYPQGLIALSLGMTVLLRARKRNISK